MNSTESTLAEQYDGDVHDDREGGFLKQLNDTYFLESPRLYHQHIDGDTSTYEDAVIGRIADLAATTAYDDITVAVGTSTLAVQADDTEPVEIDYAESSNVSEYGTEPITPSDLVVGSGIVRHDARNDRPDDEAASLAYQDIERLKDLFRDLGITAHVRMREEDVLERLEQDSTES